MGSGSAARFQAGAPSVCGNDQRVPRLHTTITESSAKRFLAGVRSARHSVWFLRSLPVMRDAAPRPDVGGVTVRPSNAAGPSIVAVSDVGISLEAVERGLIVYALEANAGNRTRSARFLGVTRSALLYRMQKFGLKGNRQPRQSGRPP